MKENNRRLEAVSRRTALKVAGSGAVSLAGVGLISAAKNDDTVEITVSRNSEGPLKRKRVLQSWYNHLQQVRKVTDEVASEYNHRAGVISVGYVQGEDRIGGKRSFAVEVEVNPDEFDGSVPEQRDNVPVTVTESATSGPMPACYNYDDFSSVPGGVTLEGDGLGTSGFEVTDENDDSGMLTANHLWGICADSGGERAEQNGNFLGEVISHDTDADFAVVDDQSDSKSLNDEIKQEGSVRWDISGWKTEDGIADLIESEEDVRSMGVTTGLTKGPVKKKSQRPYNPSCIDLEGEAVKLDIDTGQGDSGGPTYTLEIFNGNQYAVVINIVNLLDHSYGTENCYDGVASGDDRTLGRTQYGVAFHHLYDQHQIDLA